MATTVTYKGQVLVTVDNSTKVLETSGTWCEDDFTLVDVSGGGGGGLTKLYEYTPSAVRGVQVDIDSTWFDTYDYVMIVPDVTYSANDWLYVAQDSQSGGSYTAGSWAGLTPHYSMLVRSQNGGYIGVWFRTDTGNSTNIYFNVQNYFYWYMYDANKTMTGTITVYGIKF